MPRKRVKIVTRAELRALKGALSAQRQIIDVLSQRLQVVVSSLDCVAAMLSQYGVAAPPKAPTIELSVESAKMIILMLEALDGFRTENACGFDDQEQRARDELQRGVDDLAAARAAS